MKIRRSKNAILAALVVCAMVLVLVGPAVAIGNGCTPCGEKQESILYAGQSSIVGTVTVMNCEDTLCVTYELNDEAISDGWLITETHTHAAADPEDIPQKKGNPIPGKFSEKEYFDPGVTTYKVCFDLEELGLDFEDPAYVGAHAVVEVMGEFLDVDLGEAGVAYIGSDSDTKGDWTGIDDPVSSPIGRYGDCAYILPNPPRNRTEEVAGAFSTPVGFDIGDPGTYGSLEFSPWSWTSSQIRGLDFYEPDPTYYDEFWTATGMTDFTYSLSGTYMYVGTDPSWLVTTETVGPLSTRAACWFAGSGPTPPTMGIDVDVPAGSYMLSLYLLDLDSDNRSEVVTVTTSANDAHETVLSFSDGVYVNFFVHLPTAETVHIDVEKTVGTNAVVSGVFLSSTGEAPTAPGTAEVRLLGTDTSTKGTWISTYGDQGWVLSAYDVPATAVVYAWNPAYDRSSGLTYSVTGAQYAWTVKTAYVDHVQYPVFEWAWGDATASRWSDPRAAYYPVMDMWRAAVWDDGGERCKPEHGYIDFNLHFPEGRYMLSLYSYDWERGSRYSQEYQLFNAGDLTTPLVSSIVTGTVFDEGVYEIFTLEAPVDGRDMVVRVYNDAGHPEPNVNVLLQGVFVDCLRDDRDETAWGDGTDFDGKNWATYIEYEVQFCVNGGLLLE